MKRWTWTVTSLLLCPSLLQLQVELLLTLNCGYESQYTRCVDRRRGNGEGYGEENLLTSLEVNTIPSNAHSRQSWFIYDTKRAQYSPEGVAGGDTQTRSTREVEPEPSERRRA
jgi:hypothetical protein